MQFETRNETSNLATQRYPIMRVIAAARRIVRPSTLARSLSFSLPLLPEDSLVENQPVLRAVGSQTFREHTGLNVVERSRANKRESEESDEGEANRSTISWYLAVVPDATRRKRSPTFELSRQRVVKGTKTNEGKE